MLNLIAKKYDKSKLKMSQIYWFDLIKLNLYFFNNKTIHQPSHTTIMNIISINRTV